MAEKGFKMIKKRYEHMPIDEFAVFLESYNRDDFTPEAQKAIEEVIEGRQKELNDYRKQKYENMPIDELAFILESYNIDDFTAEAQKAIEEVIEGRQKELNDYRKQMEQARRSAIASCAKDLAENVINLIDGGLKGAFNSKEEDRKVFKVDGFNKITSGAVHNWLVTLSIIFISFFGIFLPLICIFALPDKTVRPLEGSLFYSGSSAMIIALLFLRWKKEKAQESKIVKYFQAEETKIVIRENISDKIIKWVVTIYSFFYAICGLTIALICIYALPDKSVQPKVGTTYFLGSAIVLGSFIFVIWKNWNSKKL